MPSRAWNSAQVGQVICISHSLLLLPLCRYRDIKSANVLLSQEVNGQIKLADFGASKRLSNASLVAGLKGTPHWMVRKQANSHLSLRKIVKQKSGFDNVIPFAS